MRWPVWIPLIFFITTGSRAHAQAQSDLPLFPWLQLATTHPLQLRWSHNISYDSKTKAMLIERSHWRMDRVGLQIFSGGATLQGHGRIDDGKATDVATSMTLASVDVQALLKFLNVPRATEMEGRISGRVVVRVAGGDFKEVEVNLQTEPGTVRLSRNLIKQVLGVALGTPEQAQKVDATLDHYFGVGTQMIPIDSMSVNGSLGTAKLNLKIPIRNRALNIDFEPLVDAGLLWEAWGFVKNAGLKDAKGIDWKLN